MNEHNPPMMLPNGQVYGEQVSQNNNLFHLCLSLCLSQALLRMSECNGGVVTCPRTSETFQYDDIKKVFVM